MNQEIAKVDRHPCPLDTAVPFAGSTPSEAANGNIGTVEFGFDSSLSSGRDPADSNPEAHEEQAVVKPTYAESSKKSRMLDFEVPETKPDYQLPCDKFGIPYGPWTSSRSKVSKSDFITWDAAYTYWIERETLDFERDYVENRNSFLSKIGLKMSLIRVRKRPAMPTLYYAHFGNRDYSGVEEGIDRGD